MLLTWQFLFQCFDQYFSVPMSVFVRLCVYLQYSLCNEPLIELSNPGASGSVFYLTKDDEFIIKTVMHKEAEFLQKLLPGYYMVSVCEQLHVRVCQS